MSRGLGDVYKRQILQQSVEVGDHILHICQVDKFLGDEDKKGLYAWNGFGKVAPAAEG